MASRVDPDSTWEQNDQRPRLGLDFSESSDPETRATFQLVRTLPERGSELRVRLCQLYGVRDGQS
jgi:hypothetical protein